MAIAQGWYGPGPSARNRGIRDLFDKRDIRHRDELELPPNFVEHQGPAILRDQAVFGLFDPHNIPTVQPKSVRNEGPPIVNFEQCFLSHERKELHLPSALINPCFLIEFWASG